ncbi:LIMR family protein DDB_G0293610 [Hondaea fermentalgiana]|uniref:LIMR family protein DDB_G0293610 n=1 Tax=Hondaea fermentalgiana TaxID=2315210 RepID=A0A2R5G8J8_9STRA|nr:LIMR family protein DDB_G0293610 [Hondaea fermentalgiana]|eukprot:GBG26649.1 LIMR family protein DDB_G0293610 [Hondaea fermentalgiana]
MVDVWLIVLAVVVPVVVLVFNYYILVYYQHPDDRNTSWFSKIVVLLGMTIGMVTVLIIPFDVANQGTEFGCGVISDLACGGLDLFWVWQAAFLIIGAWVLLFIPYTIFFYESFDFETKTTCAACAAAAWPNFAITIIFAGAFVVCYFFLRYTAPPVQNYTVTELSFQDCPGGSCELAGLTVNPNQELLASSQERIKFGTPVLVFLPGFLSFIGWFLFALYVGIGLAALPVDLVYGYIYRPKYMSNKVYADTKVSIQKQTAELIEAGVKLLDQAHKEADGEQTVGASVRSTFNFRKFKRKREEKTLFNEFKQSVVELEEEYEALKLCHENWKNFNPFIPWCKLIGGILAAILSLLWVLQIILYNLVRSPYGPEGVPAEYFLNVMFNAASKEIHFALVGTILIGVFTFYLLFCVMKGNERFGLRFFIIEIHPMKWNGTYMNSFLINTSLILLCIAPLIQFIGATLSEYVVLTEMDAIFGQQITYMLFFRWFYENNVFIIAMLAIALITSIWLIFFPQSKHIRQAKFLSKKIEQFKLQTAEREREAKLLKKHKNSAVTGDEAEAGDKAASIREGEGATGASASTQALQQT